MCECQWWWCTFIYWFWSDRSNSQARVSAQHQPIKYSESNITLFPLLEHWNHLENGDKLNDGLYFRFSSSRQETSIVFFFYWNGGRVRAMLENCRAGPIRYRSNHSRMLFGVSLMTFTQLSRKCSFILKIKIVRFEYILNSAVDTMTW